MTDQRYRAMVGRVKGMIFLSTPHRGSKYATILNNILSAAPIGVQKKPFISELDGGSISLQHINDQFKNVCDGLDLVSFWESRKTRLAPGVSKWVVERSCAVLGFPKEYTSSLEADHHTICKFKSVEDSNFIHVKRLITMVATADDTEVSSGITRSSAYNAMKHVGEILNVEAPPNDDLALYRSRSLPDSCRWMKDRESVVKWLDFEASCPRILCLTGLPGTGKSTVASRIVELVQTSLGENACQYFFFSYADPMRKTTACFLRSMAFQMAEADETFRIEIESYQMDTRMPLATQKASFIWEIIYNKILTDNGSGTRTCWVIDGLDEAENPQSVLNYVKELPVTDGLRIFLVSRPSKELKIALGDRAVYESVRSTDTQSDIRDFVHDYAQKALPENPNLTTRIVDDVLEKADGSFLWVRLILDRLKDNWHTSNGLQRVLAETPPGMESLYHSMINAVASQEERLRDLAVKVIIWTACAFRPIRVEELEEALEPEFGSFSNLQGSIVQICGHFIKLDGDNMRVTHETAKDYFFHNDGARPIRVGFDDSNEYIALTCIRYLCNNEWKRRFERHASGVAVESFSKSASTLDYFKDRPFFTYAAKYWSFHVSRATPKSPAILQALQSFLSEYLLAWINAASLMNDLRTITRAAIHLKSFVSRYRLQQHEQPPEALARDTDFISLWASDLNHLVGKFGPHMIREPKSIYRQIPPFCPKASMTYKTYASDSHSLVTAGSLRETWDDCIARIGAEEDQEIWKIFCTDSYILTLFGAHAKVVLWYSDTFRQAGVIHHEGELISMIAVNYGNPICITVGPRWWRIWELSSQRKLRQFERNTERYTKAISFSNDDRHVLVAYDDCSVVCRDLDSFEIVWTFVAEDAAAINFGTPKVVEFSPDGCHIAIGYKGRPVWVWDLEHRGEQVPRRCVRSEDRLKPADAGLSFADEIRWTHDGEAVLILYHDTQLVMWRVFDETQSEFGHVYARTMVLHKDSSLLLTSDARGSMSVWTLPKLRLVYRLNYDSFVRDLAFSPDAHRILDARGSTCHIWEPDVLAYYNEVDRGDAQVSLGEASTGAEAAIADTDHGQSQVTTIVCDDKDLYYCCGRDDGSVSIHAMIDGHRLRKLYSHDDFTAVVTLTWSSSLKFIISGDDSGRVIAKRLRFKDQRWAVYPLFDFGMESWIQQILFSRDEQYVLLCSRTSYQIWNMNTKAIIEIGAMPSCAGRWINHPSEEKLLVWLEIKWDAVELAVRSWAPTIEERPQSTQSSSRMMISETGQYAPGSRSSPVSRRLSQSHTDDRVFVHWAGHADHIKENIFYRATTSSIGTFGHKSGVFELGVLPISSIASTPGKTRTDCQSMKDVSNDIFYFLGIHHSHLIYIDKKHCLCTWPLNSNMRMKRSHFYLPRDWTSQLGLQPALLSNSGTLLCGRGQHVVTVRYDLRG
ncbi:MAG: hypothetical protein M1828_006608 [Chrysothrix sp. TS-e1954]|nr:MAG: hypothetical protein M1828_006608 [Chrysothrix sp. TS-e1954]